MKISTRKEAIENGDVKYFTGKPCKRGHVSERYTSTYQCCECHTRKEKLMYEKKVETRKP